MYRVQEEEELCRKSLDSGEDRPGRSRVVDQGAGTGDGGKWGEFYHQHKSIGITIVAKLPSPSLAPVASIRHSEDGSVFTHPCARDAEGEEQDEGSWHEELHPLHSAYAEGELVYRQENLYPAKAICLSPPVH